METFANAPFQEFVFVDCPAKVEDRGEESHAVVRDQAHRNRFQRFGFGCDDVRLGETAKDARFANELIQEKDGELTSETMAGAYGNTS